MANQNNDVETVEMGEGVYAFPREKWREILSDFMFEKLGIEFFLNQDDIGIDDDEINRLLEKSKGFFYYLDKEEGRLLKKKCKFYFLSRFGDDIEEYVDDYIYISGADINYITTPHYFIENILDVKEMALDCYHDVMKNIVNQDSTLNNSTMGNLKRGLHESLNPNLDPFVSEVKEVVKEKLLHTIKDKIDEFELDYNLHSEERVFLNRSFFNFVTENKALYQLSTTEIDVVSEFFDEYAKHKIDFYLDGVEFFIDKVLEETFESNISYSSSKDFDMENYASTEVLSPLFDLIGHDGDLTNEDRKEKIEDLLESSQEYLDCGVVKFLALNGISLDSLETNEKLEALKENYSDIKKAIDSMLFNIDNTDHVTPVFINNLNLQDIIELSVFEQLNKEHYTQVNQKTSVYQLLKDDVTKLGEKLKDNGFEIPIDVVNLHCAVYGRTSEFNDRNLGTNLLVKNVVIPFNYFQIGNDFLGNYGYSPQDVVQGEYKTDVDTSIKLTKVDEFNKNILNHFVKGKMDEVAKLAIEHSEGIENVKENDNTTTITRPKP